MARTDARRRTAVVTGAAGGIGLACARALLARGDAVALLDRDGRALRAVAARLTAEAGPDRVLAAEVDVSDGFAVREARDDVTDRLGPADLVVAGAGTMTGGGFDDGVPGEWAEMVDTNLTGMLHTAQAYVRDLTAAADAGHRSDLVLVGAIAGTVGYPRFAVYSAVAAAVAQLSRTLRVELGPRGVRVHQVQPGVTGTRLGSSMSDRAARREWAALRDAVPPADPAVVAQAVLFGVDQPPHVTVADMVVLPTRQDGRLPTVQGAAPAPRRRGLW